VVLFVTTATMANRDVTIMVTARATGFLVQQRRKGLALVQLIVDDFNHAATASGRRLDFYECHLVHLRKVEFLTVLERDIGLARIAATTYETAKALFLAILVQDLNGLDFHFKEEFDGRLDFRLGGVGSD